MEERYFRGAKGDICLPHEGKRNYGEFAFSQAHRGRLPRLANQSIRDDSPPHEPTRDFTSSGLSMLTGDQNGVQL